MPYRDPERQRQYQREWCARRRSDWFAGKSCVDCGSTDDLELDHVDRSTKVSHSVWSWSEARREAELAKCVVRCVAHHRAKGQLAGDLGSGHRRIPLQDVMEIRYRYATGFETQESLAEEYGTTQQHVSKIVLDQRRVFA